MTKKYHWIRNGFIALLIAFLCLILFYLLSIFIEPINSYKRDLASFEATSLCSECINNGQSKYDCAKKSCIHFNNITAKKYLTKNEVETEVCGGRETSYKEISRLINNGPYISKEQVLNYEEEQLLQFCNVKIEKKPIYLNYVFNDFNIENTAQVFLWMLMIFWFVPLLIFVIGAVFGSLIEMIIYKRKEKNIIRTHNKA